MIDRLDLLGGYQGSFVSITMIDRLRLLGGYQGIFASITMIDRHRLLGGCQGIFVSIIHRFPLFGALWQEIFVSITMIDRLRLLGDCCKHNGVYHNHGPASIIGGLLKVNSWLQGFGPLLFGALGFRALLTLLFREVVSFFLMWAKFYGFEKKLQGQNC